MRLAILPCLVAQLVLAAPAARAQSLVSEEIAGNHRLCNYTGPNSILSGSARGPSYRVGIAENCPLTYPVLNNGTPPPTAPLRSDTPALTGRICTYEQWGSVWTFNLPACPPAAGMAAQSLPPPTGRVPPPSPIRGQ
jgi:hypothetical protein